MKKSKNKVDPESVVAPKKEFEFRATTVTRLKIIALFMVAMNMKFYAWLGSDLKPLNQGHFKNGGNLVYRGDADVE